MQVSFIQKSIVVAFGAMAMLGATAGAGHSFTFNEATDTATGDAGALRFNAADLGTLTSSGTILGKIAGSAALPNNADLYKFTLTTAGTFMASTFTPGGAGPNLGNPQLFLFNDLGQGLASNDNISALNVQSKVTQLLTAGVYYLGISTFDLDPRANPSIPIFNLDGTVATSNPLTGWNRFSRLADSGGNYGINLSFDAAKVPSPALLPGFVALGFSAIRKRKAKAAVA